VWFFLATAFAISWGAFFLRQATQWPGAVDEALRLITKFGPSLAGLAAAMLVSGIAGVRDILRRLLKVPVGLAWFTLALALPMVILLCCLVIRSALGGDVWRTSGLTVASGAGLYLALLATRFFAGGGLGEELGWRGFMLPHLQARLSPLHASIVIGLFHGAWHLPAYGVATLFLTVFTVSGAIIFTWMYNRTDGNLLLPALMHASANASLPFLEALFPAIDGELAFPLLVFALWAVLAVFLVRRMGPSGITAVEAEGARSKE
jgi:membrane protease YdiL (CAAX protease family)